VTRKPDPDPAARHRLVKAATRLMLSRGYSATSVNDVCAEGGQTKGSFFHYFPTKEDLGAAVLDTYIAQVFARLEAIRSEQPDPLVRVFACLEFLADASQVYPLKEGCILGRFTQELAQTVPRFRESCSAHFARWISQIEADLSQAASARGIGRLDARSLAEHAVAAFEGSLILAKAAGDPRIVRNSTTHTRNYLARVFGLQNCDSL
jgi:TetR/AcrR family transcriptional repressor of nem operon